MIMGRCPMLVGNPNMRRTMEMLCARIIVSEQSPALEQVIQKVLTLQNLFSFAKMIKNLTKRSFFDARGYRNMSDTEYRIIRSRRRTMAIEITPDAEVLVRVPLMMSDEAVAGFVNARRDWIEKNLEKVRNRAVQKNCQPKLTQDERRRLVDEALKTIPERVAYFAPRIGVTYGYITIRNQRTRWGSCSSKGNLNFNYLLVMMPAEVLDYVVVHELCHRKEMNHSTRFWAEVAKVFPDHKRVRKWLKDNGSAYLARESSEI